jgi:hypothetical protein
MGDGVRARVMRRAVAVVLLVVVTGCSSVSSNTGPNTATIRGLLVWPMGSQPLQLHPEATSGVVKVLKGSVVVTTLKVGKTGQFSIVVAPGTYTLAGLPSLPAPGRFVAACSGRAVARMGTSTPVDVDCHYIAAAPG